MHIGVHKMEEESILGIVVVLLIILLLTGFVIFRT